MGENTRAAAGDSLQYNDPQTAISNVMSGFYSFDSFDYDSAEAVFEGAFDADATRPCLAIVAAVAGISNRDESDLAPINTAIDVDALNTLLDATRSKGGDVSCSFTWEGFHVEVTGAGRLTLRSQ